MEIVMEILDADFWIRFSPVLFLIFLGMIVAWATWPEEKARMKRKREILERREQQEKNKRDGVADLALVTMPLWMDDDSNDSSSSSSSDSDSSSSSSSSYSDFIGF
jgi:cbb3-type cytochrome oxidase subunit 3